MRYGISIPNGGDFFSPQVVGDLAHEVEECGWDGMFIWDHVLLWNEGKLPISDP